MLGGDPDARARQPSSFPAPCREHQCESARGARPTLVPRCQGEPKRRPARGRCSSKGSAYVAIAALTARGNPHAAFQTLLGLSTRHQPTTYRQIIDHLPQAAESPRN